MPNTVSMLCTRAVSPSKSLQLELSIPLIRLSGLQVQKPQQYAQKATLLPRALHRCMTLLVMKLSYQDVPAGDTKQSEVCS